MEYLLPISCNKYYVHNTMSMMTTKKLILIPSHYAKLISKWIYRLEIIDEIKKMC
jgi:hypothetical protein